MHVIALSRLARRLREIALTASQHGESLPISVAELAVVEAVARHPGSSISDISQRCGLAQSWVSTIVRELVGKGVFSYDKNPRDRRQTWVRLDPEVHRQMFEDYGARSTDAAVAAAAPHLDQAGVTRVQELLAELEALLVPAEVTRDEAVGSQDFAAGPGPGDEETGS